MLTGNWCKRSERRHCFVLDGDIVIDHRELQRFIKGIQQGHQIVVNNLTWSVYLKDETALYDSWKIYVESLFE